MTSHARLFGYIYRLFSAQVVSHYDLKGKGKGDMDAGEDEDGDDKGKSMKVHYRNIFKVFAWYRVRTSNSDSSCCTYMHRDQRAEETYRVKVRKRRQRRAPRRSPKRTKRKRRYTCKRRFVWMLGGARNLLDSQVLDGGVVERKRIISVKRNEFHKRVSLKFISLGGRGGRRWLCKGGARERG